MLNNFMLMFVQGIFSLFLFYYKHVLACISGNVEYIYEDKNLRSVDNERDNFPTTMLVPTGAPQCS